MDEWKFLGALCAAMAAFAVVFAIAFAVTRGSAWMLAFFPLFIGAPASAALLVIRGGKSAGPPDV